MTSAANHCAKGRNLILPALGLLAVASFVGVPMRAAQDRQVPFAEGLTPVVAQQRTIRAPEFPTGLQWLNTDRPLTLAELRGKVVLLDFWTYCCINCMHIIPDLKRLEAKYPDELVVIGVHSAKFDAERDVENIRSAILRYEIEHPVVNDRDLRVWDAYAVRAWPTVVLIDPVGKIVATRAGEGVFDAFDGLIAQTIVGADRAGELDRAPLDLRPERAGAMTGVLAFPGKVLADEHSGRLFIADSGNNRIVVTTLDGEVLDVAGSGAIGRDDGSFEAATFNHPQGMALDGDALYVADTENHALRRLHLRQRTVTTIAGTGRQAVRVGQTGVPARVDLSSPWDLSLDSNLLFIAMAGVHQIWYMDVRAGRIEPYAGSGAEGLVDGTRSQAALAQPSGITSDGRRLYFADAEASAIRWADLPPGHFVGTIVGRGLFDFGDRDGIGNRAALQHPLGITHHAGELYVADTYNNKIKRVNARRTSVETLLGTGEAGLRDGEPALFDEPGGVSYADGRLFIADTNNHAIRVAPVDGGPVTTLQLHPLDRLTPAALPECPLPRVAVGAQTIAPGAAELVIDLTPGAGYHLNEQAPASVELRLEGTALAPDDGALERTIADPSLPLRVPLIARVGEDRVTARLTYYYCAEGSDAACYFDQVELTAPVTVAADAAGHEVRLTYQRGAGG